MKKTLLFGLLLGVSFIIFLFISPLKIHSQLNNLPAAGGTAEVYSGSSYVGQVTSTPSSQTLGSNTTINFDNLPATGGGPGHPIPATSTPGALGGIHFYYVSGASTYDGNSGYHAGMTSAPNVAFNGYADPASILASNATSTFDLLRAEMTGAWNDGLQVNVVGYGTNGAIKYNNTYTLSATAPTLINFNYMGVNHVSFTSSGGTNHGYQLGLGGTQFVMDDVVVNLQSVPAAPVLTSLSPSAVNFGSTITITGSGFDALNNTIKFTNNVVGAQNLTILTTPSTNNGTTLTVNIPSTASAGTYTVQVSAGSGNLWSNSLPLTIKDPRGAPSNLTATLASTGKVTLKWKDNSSTEAGFQIEKATYDSEEGFNTFGRLDYTKSNVVSYIDNLSTLFLNTAGTPYRVAALLSDGTLSDYSNTAYASNCILISGDANAPYKIVFRGSTSLTSTPLGSVQGFLSNAQRVIKTGFGGTEPFKTYIGQFAFYADLSNGNNYHDGSVCDRNSTPPADAYITYVNAPGDDPAHTILLLFGGYRAIPEETISIAPYRIESAHGTWDWNYYTESPKSEMHETGHAFAGLLDEYTYSMYGSAWNFSQETGLGISTKNCTTLPSRDYWDPVTNKIYGGKWVTGCSYIYKSGILYSPKDTNYVQYYRPSVSGIMNTTIDNTGNINSPDKFNVIDCGYIVARIKGVPFDQLTPETAAPWWPECKTMALKGTVIMDGIPPVYPTPTIKMSSTSLSQGDPTITGTNFSTTTDNTVRLANTASSTQIYYISNIASPDTKTLTFTISTTTPSGTYKLSVGAFNSNWSSSVTVTIYPKLNASAISCTYSITPQGTKNFDSFTFTGVPQGGLIPYTYSLKNIVSGTSISSVTVKVPGTYSGSTFYNKKLDSSYLLVTSKDKQTASTTCQNSAPVPVTPSFPAPVTPTPVPTPAPGAPTPNPTSKIENGNSFLANVLEAIKSLFTK